MDDLHHNCPDCHELVRSAPTEHHCGRTPEGTLPASQPHKVPAYRSTAPTASPPSMAGVLAGFREMARTLSEMFNHPPTQDDYTLAGPSEDHT